MNRKVFTTLGITSFIIIALFIGTTLTEHGATSVYASSSGSPGAKTNSPGDGANCTQCHGGALNPGSATAVINSAGLTGGYVPGQTYTMNVAITGTSSSKIGFEATVERDSDNSKTGTIAITDALRTKSVNSGNAVTHNATAGTTASSGSNGWTFDWTAPSAGTGNVTFYAAFNATNSSGTTIGDQVYTATFNVSENTGVGLAELQANSSVQLYPSPVTNSFHVSTGENVESIVVYRLNGQEVLIENNDQGKVNVEQLPAGIYVVHVKTETSTTTHKLIKN